MSEDAIRRAAAVYLDIEADVGDEDEDMDMDMEDELGERREISKRGSSLNQLRQTLS